MNLHGYKILALFRKDFKDTLKNGQYLLLCILPLGMTALYAQMSFGGFQMDTMFVLSIGLLMNLGLFPISATATMIAEEKEKHTLRTLMLSNVSAVEFLISKVLVVFLFMQAVNLGIYALARVPSIALPNFLLITSLSSISTILLGALVGLLARNQVSTGMFAAPIALLLMLPAMFAMISDEIANLARFLPTYAMLELIGVAPGRGLSPYIVLLAWTVLAGVLFALVYRRKRLD